MSNSMGKTECKYCERPHCDGKHGQLRDYSSWSDLSAHADENDIVIWVNELAKIKQAQRFYHTKSRKRRELLEKTARQVLAPDELREIERLAGIAASKHVEGEV